METVICGDGPMGRALADELHDAGQRVRLLGRPAGGGHTASDFAGAQVVHEFSTAAAVEPNLRAALAAGCRRFVIGTTGWTADRRRVESMVVEHGAAAVVAPTFSPGAVVLLRTAEAVAAGLARLGGYDPFVIEWHRAAKRDRPSGTAAELAGRMGSASTDGGAPEIASLRAGHSPGMHLVGFDAPGETLELRLTARDRRCYAAGARLAAGWLVAAERAPGFHPFDSVVDELIADGHIAQPAHERTPA